jgi:cytochrome bd-type quinol oxidase subunit 2
MGTLVTFLGNATDFITRGATGACQSACNTGTTVSGIFSGLANALIFIVGAVSVIMVIVGGLRYVISNGDSKQTSAAKDTILYAVVGVVVAVAAFAIVKFVTTNIR